MQDVSQTLVAVADLFAVGEGPRLSNAEDGFESRIDRQIRPHRARQLKLRPCRKMRALHHPTSDKVMA